MSRSGVWLVGLCCALPGGWLAGLAWTVSTPVRVGLVLAAALVGTTAATRLVAVPSAPLSRPDPHRLADRAPARPAVAEVPTDRVRTRLPAGPDDAATVPDADGAERAALIAQCPRCGELRLDSGRHGPAFRFRCANPGCGHAWTWHPGEPWPPVVISRTLPADPPRPY